MDNNFAEKMFFNVYDTDAGEITVVSNGEEITELRLGKVGVDNAVKEELPVMEQAYLEIQEYLKGQRKDFDVPLRLEGSDYQKKVWNIVRRIPYGQTITYKDVAEELGKKKAFRAVGGAIGKNPILILVPCHRIVGLDGSLTGYAGGIERKKQFLQIEHAI